MTTIQTNKLGLDIVDVQVECTGESQTDMYFQEPVLDSARDYVLGISELSVPLASESLITNDESLLSENILEIKYLYDEQNNETYDPTDILTRIPDEKARFRLDRYLVSSPADIVYQLARFFYHFSQSEADTVEASVLTSPSGILRIRGSKDFWLNYFIELTPFGMELFGYNQKYVAVVKTQNMTVPSTTDLLQQNGRFIQTDDPNFGTQEVHFIHSVFRYVENRLRIEVDADLAIPSNILVENGQHKLHYNIASFAIPQDYKATGTVNTSPILTTGVLHETHLYVGNTVIKRKETPTTDWYKLMSAANVQNMRLHLLLVRRVWNNKDYTWKLTRDKLKVAENGTWFATLKFVEQF